MPKSDTYRRYLLKSKRDFFASHKREQEFIDNLAQFGDVAIFGGILRDFAFRNFSRPTSDIDIVINSSKKECILNILNNFCYSKNNFDGYRIKNKGIKDFDVWFLEDTWAFKNKIINREPSFDALLDTTFFNVDSILYLTSSNRFLKSEKYFSYLENKRLDICLEENPNPLSSFVRAIYLSNMLDLKVGRKLFHFLKKEIKKIDANLIEKSAQKKYGIYSFFSKNSIENILNKIDMHSENIFFYNENILLNQEEFSIF